MLQALSLSGNRTSWLDRVDPRSRLVGAVGLSVVVAMADRLTVLGLAAGVAIVALLAARLALPVVLKRLLPLNVLLLTMLVLLPMTTPGTHLFQLGPVGFSQEGLLLGVRIVLKGNTIVLVLMALLGPIDAVTLGHALGHLHVPKKLAHLLLFTVRYLDVLYGEYARLRDAMRVRGFRPAMNRHTYRTFGYLIGMLLISGFDRSEGIAAAMKCRAFRGRFYLLDHFAMSRRDVPFAMALALIVGLLIWMEWA